MARREWVIVVALLSIAYGCVGDSNNNNDGGQDAMTADGAKETGVDAAMGQCVFGTSHFGDGCQFGP